MTGRLQAALAVEARKLVASRVALVATILLVAGVAVLTASMVAAADAGNLHVLAQLGRLADETGWTRVTGVGAQITAAAAFLGFGVIVAWVIGREFTDGTIGGLFALPVPRATIAAAKLIVALVWTAVVAVGLTVAVAAVGIIVAGSPDRSAVEGLLRLVVLAGLCGLLATPAAWAATLGRGVLAGIAVTIVLIATAQVLAVVGVGAWFPLAAPALWALDPAAVTGAQLGLVALVPFVFGALTMWSWSRLQLDR